MQNNQFQTNTQRDQFQTFETSDQQYRGESAQGKQSNTQQKQVRQSESQILMDKDFVLLKSEVSNPGIELVGGGMRQMQQNDVRNQQNNIWFINFKDKYLINFQHFLSLYNVNNLEYQGIQSKINTKNSDSSEGTANFAEKRKSQSSIQSHKTLSNIDEERLLPNKLNDDIERIKLNQQSNQQNSNPIFEQESFDINLTHFIYTNFLFINHKNVKFIIDIDDVINSIPFGKFQLIFLVIAFLHYINVSVIVYNYGFFLMYPPSYQCDYNMNTDGSLSVIFYLLIRILELIKTQAGINNNVQENKFVRIQVQQMLKLTLPILKFKMYIYFIYLEFYNLNGYSLNNWVELLNLRCNLTFNIQIQGISIFQKEDFRIYYEFQDVLRLLQFQCLVPWTSQGSCSPV